MTMDEIKSEVQFLMGIPANENVEDLEIERSILIAFRELKRYIRTPVDKTVPYSTRLNLSELNIHTRTVLNVFAAIPRIGLTMNTIDAGNVFQIAAAVNTYSMIGNTTSLNIDPIMTEMAMAQVRNTLGTDFQWNFDKQNNVIYCAHRDPRPSVVTIRYVPDFQDVSEILGYTYIDYLVRMSVANYKLALGRTRSKYTVEGSNVTLDGETLLAEGNAELEAIRSELDNKQHKLVIVN
jgi:hypothetical protein